MKFTKLLLFCFSSLLFSVYGQAQDQSVSGKVIDEAGLPLPGVTVLIQGTTLGTATDIDGNYQMKATSTGTLVFSFVGYTTSTQAINGRSVVDVKLLPQSESLNEVVVVGYGTQKKSVVTGSISSVRAKDLENLPITRVEQALQGRISGVTIAANSGQPGAASTIRIRGITTLNNNNPLYVVDGVIVDANGIGFLNQSDIESIEVLKDAASAAIYGTRGAAGVILISTKKGKSGKIVVNYNGYSGTSKPSRKLDLLNATQYATLRNEASVNGGGSIIYADPASFGKGTDWQGAIFNNNASKESHEISMSGGNETSTFYVSFGLLDQQGIVSSDISNYNRKNIRLNSTHKIGKWFTFGETAGFSREKTVGIGNTNSEFGGPLASAINLDPITPLVVTDPAVAAAAPYTNTGAIKDANGNFYGISNLVANEMSNPLAYAQTRMGNYDYADNFVANAYMEVQPIKGLKFRTTVGGKQAYYGNYSFTPIYYLNANSSTVRNNLFKSSNRSFGWNVENTLSYTKSIENHNFTILAGQGAYVDDMGDGQGIRYYNQPVTRWQDASFNWATVTDDIEGYGSKTDPHKVSSLFARVNYDFNEKYLVTGVIRRDGSTRFGSNNQYATFPSFSLGWVPSKEGFWKENKVVTSLKFRGGYGVTGNDGSGNFAYLSIITGGYNYPIGDGGNVTIGNGPKTIPNPDLKWEETTQTNIAFDATLFNDFNLTVELFNKKTTGILRQKVLPGYVGVTENPYYNVGSMENKGIELEMSYRKKIGDFTVGLSGNISYLKNKVTGLGTDETFYDGPSVQSSTYPITRTEVGQSFGSFYGFSTNGIFQNQAEINSYVNSGGQVIQPNAVPGDFKWKDLDDNGVIDDKDRSYIGSPLPDYTYGFTLNLNYKNFDLLAFGQGVAGNQIYQGLRRLDLGNANYQTNALNRWTGEGTSNTFPRVSTSDNNKNFSNPSNFYLQDGDYLRLKTIQIGYSLPTDVLEKVGLTRVRLYVTGENLVTFTKYTGYDPEIGGDVMGIDRGYYPQAKTYMFGINLQF